jgi:hypothetical protein
MTTDAHKHCDICEAPCTEKYYDAKTVLGPWATLCETCFKTYNAAVLGTGRGQEFTKVDGKWIKTAG